VTARGQQAHHLATEGAAGAGDEDDRAHPVACITSVAPAAGKLTRGSVCTYHAGIVATVDVFTSGIWQLSSVIVADGGDCLVIDPGYFPRELEELSRAASVRGRVSRVVFTHGHWDHVLGWRSFPGAEVVGSPRLAADVAGGTALAGQNLAAARDFDGRWYVDRGAPLAWPDAVRAAADGDTLRVGGASLRALSLPGHSPDGLALLLDAPRLLFAGDYLSPCEIPFVDDVDAYRETLRRLLAILPELDGVIPGHGPRLEADRAVSIARADLEYLDALARGETEIALPRAADVPGMREHHDENVAAARRRTP
jgi:glyoxylase-like metal-dependent hydrolase (beta-lactamase superfamily II)